LGTERIGKLLRSFAIPGIISMVINSLYNMVDQIFIGQGVGMLGNGATNIIAPIATFAIAIASLFGDGLATYFSLQLGKGKPEEASRAVGTSLISGAAASILLSGLVLAFLTPLCRVFGATDNILPYAQEYGSIIALGFPFVIIAVIINGVVRADGSPTYSMISMMVGSLLNFFLDPLFIFVL
ncbi:MAG: MATE family efflux transporter, partial [Lachnospiraceae bacterium]|nr:MATE family efflux transporter [Lachnospiraceae bacterium]